MIDGCSHPKQIRSRSSPCQKKLPPARPSFLARTTARFTLTTSRTRRVNANPSAVLDTPTPSWPLPVAIEAASLLQEWTILCERSLTARRLRKLHRRLQGLEPTESKSFQLISYPDCRSATVPTGSQPTALAVDGQDTQYVATSSEIQQLQAGKKAASIPASYNPQSVAVSSQALLAAGGSVSAPTAAYSDATMAG